jgi:hypothetical protein
MTLAFSVMFRRGLSGGFGSVGVEKGVWARVGWALPHIEGSCAKALVQAASNSDLRHESSSPTLPNTNVARSTFSRAAAPPRLSSLSRLTHLSFECSEHGEQPGFLHAMSRLHELLLPGPVLGDAIEADGSPGQGGHGADLLPGLRTVAVRGPLSNLQAHPERAAAAAVQWLASRRFLVDLAAAGSYLGPTLEALPEGLEVRQRYVRARVYVLMRACVCACRHVCVWLLCCTACRAQRQASSIRC